MKHKMFINLFSVQYTQIHAFCHQDKLNKKKIVFFLKVELHFKNINNFVKTLNKLLFFYQIFLE